MNRTIQYAIHRDDGVVVSRVGRELAWPVLDYVAIGQGGDGFPPGDFRGPTRYTLERVALEEARYDWPRLRWTRKIPTPLKNLHRAFWQMDPLPVPDDAPRLPL